MNDISQDYSIYGRLILVDKMKPDKWTWQINVTVIEIAAMW